MHPLIRSTLRATYPLYRPALTAFGLINVMARMHEADKAGHGYLRHYRHHFGSFRWKKIKLFEIGVGGRHPTVGAHSLRMWKDYFPRAEIFSIDIRKKRGLEQPRIRIFQGSQNDPDFLNDFGSRYGPFDLIIDDGSHNSQHVITSFTSLFPHLKDNGFYVIEDLFFSFDPTNGGSADDLDSPHTSLGMLKTLVDDMHSKYIPREARSVVDRITGLYFYPKICFVRKGDNSNRDAIVDAYYVGRSTRDPGPAHT